MLHSDSLILQFHHYVYYVLVYCLKCSPPSSLLTLQKKYIFQFSRLSSNTTFFFDTNTLNWPLSASTKSYRMFIIVPITLDSSCLPLGLRINPPSPIWHSVYCELLKGGDSIWIYLYAYFSTLLGTLLLNEQICHSTNRLYTFTHSYFIIKKKFT